MKQKFTLSKSNKIYFGIIAALTFVSFVAFSDKTASQIGEFTGRLIFFLLLPSIFAWIVWRLRGRKGKGGSVTFNIVLTLILLGHIGQLGNKLPKTRELGEIQEQINSTIPKTASVQTIVQETDSMAADIDKGLKAFEEGDYATALKEWKPLAEKGQAKAQSSLALLYAVGKGVPKDSKQAAMWYTKAAKQGDIYAQSSLGLMYAVGRGVPKDFKQAFKWLTKAAKQGDVSAQYNLGVTYAKGEGVPLDDEAAVKWYTKAAEQGHEKAQLKLDLIYKNGQGIPLYGKQAVE